MSNSERSTVRAMTYNIRHGLGMDGVLDLGRIARVIAAETPDIVAVQEVDRFWSRSGGIDQAEHLAELLGMDWRFAPNLEMPPERPGEPPVQYGVMLLSRFPIHSWHHTLYPQVVGWESRGLLEIDVEIESGQRLVAMCTHFQVDGKEGCEESLRQRTEQIAIMAERASSRGIPVIMMGDYNATPDAPELAAVLGSGTGWHDAWHVAGRASNGMTIPAHPDREPERRIDYILTNAASTVIGCEVRITPETRLASDHFPVIADLQPDVG
jgi:endonuclease/exonuclease/phosphatase family metal-dependent hydrolase